MKFIQRACNNEFEDLQEAFDDAVEEWHTGDSQESLLDFLGISDVMFSKLLSNKIKLQKLVDLYKIVFKLNSLKFKPLDVIDIEIEENSVVDVLPEEVEEVITINFDDRRIKQDILSDVLTPYNCSKLKKYLEALHNYSDNNQKDLETGKFSCFYCFHEGEVSEIKEWITRRVGSTALCPKCSIDAVLPHNINYPVDNILLLKLMNDYWFKSYWRGDVQYDKNHNIIDENIEDDYDL